ncbi:DEAD/DEAH box helicase [Pasteurellaceae bacterium 20609_3]|uniref:DEAD/DEAH box helicase n=1 Tax=Spirabiliibacterium mucosae TaxID=28156 RepID=UPI001AADBB9C|nr:DEAD/DEAH box helicase [Spirabiliibacterium mucosae]MBE2897821.1 DEAD/DEAH box helicase [Spirabiliibacterium mucosae]
MATNIPSPFAHQASATKFWLEKTPIVANFSDPGTGKTRATLDAINQRGTGKRTLVVAPLSILQPSWGEDITKFTPNLTYSIADSKNREKAFKQDTDIVLINHDGVKALASKKDLLSEFDTIVVDESTAFKNRTSQRSKAIDKLVEGLDHRIILSGTPNSNGVLDLWHQIYMLDGGERLGKNFFGFRNATCEPRLLSVGGRQITLWTEKPRAIEQVTSMLADIVIRFKFEDVVEIPDNYTRTITVDIPPQIRKLYKEFMNTAVLATDEGDVLAINAAVKMRKLLQLLTGAVYDSEGNVKHIHSNRYNLVIDLVEETDFSVVAFNWKHEKEALTQLARARQIPFGVIDGETPTDERTRIVREYQEGNLRVVFAHPQSAGHGLTLTRGNRTIWASPTYNAEHYQQFCRRIYRIGQQRKTETIRIAAKGTVEEGVYEKLEGKLSSMDDLLHYVKRLYQANK